MRSENLWGGKATILIESFAEIILHFSTHLNEFDKKWFDIFDIEQFLLKSPEDKDLLNEYDLSLCKNI